MEHATSTKPNKHTQYSKKWKNWITQLDLKTCQPCVTMHGKIFPLWDFLIIRPPLHLFCRCKIKPMEAIAAGQATQDGTAGADYWLKVYGQLPKNYISKASAEQAGWIPKEGDFDSILPGRIIGGDVYRNRDGHLPTAEGRIWYEADINYTGGFRGVERVLYSNDGLIFITYDHYETFAEIV